MQLPDIPLLSLLKDRMSWLNQRQSLLSQNVANADTPGYSAHDLKPMDFEAALKRATHPFDPSGGLSITNARHISINGHGTQNFADEPLVAEATPGGNTVSFEAEMIKVSETQAQYQAAANLYSKALSMMRTAIGSGN